MSKIKLDIDYKRKAEDVAKVSNVQLTIDYLNFFVNSAFKEGLKGQMSRIWGRIQRKLDDAEVKKSESIEVEEAEKDFLKKAIENENVLYPSTLSKYFVTFEDEIWSLDKK